MTIAADFIASLQSYEREDQVVRGLVKAMSIYLKTDIVDGQLLWADELHLVAQTGWPSDALNLVKVLPLDAGTVCARAAKFRRPLAILDTLEDQEFKPYRDVSQHVGFRSIYSTPLLSNGSLVGVASALFEHPRSIPTEMLPVVGILAQFAADAIHQLRAMQLG